jgi:ADP-ribosylglycohydrolase
VCGQIADAFYGERAIPAAGLERLCMADHIRALSDALAASPEAGTT